MDKFRVSSFAENGIRRCASDAFQGIYTRTHNPARKLPNMPKNYASIEHCKSNNFHRLLMRIFRRPQ
jgi:hypothetical protein